MRDTSWLACEKKDVQVLKSFLDARGHLSRDDKVRPWREGLMIIPTHLTCIGDDMLYDMKELNLDNSRVQLTEEPDYSSRQVSVQNLEDVVTEWLVAVPEGPIAKPADSFTEVPKRWSTYSPMVLLPAGSFQSLKWMAFLASHDALREELWRRILAFVCKREGGAALTHLAVNSGIPLSEDSEHDEENILRSPSGLVMLYGDFGPQLDPLHKPTQNDFENAFWVSTKQNGIWQTWAPRYTMFSRGNIKEKARVLAFHDPKTAMTVARQQAFDLGRSAAVDLYAGIGYFVFSYAAMGMYRIWCWEINPWSVEGLRRGAVRNKWPVKIVKGDDLRLETSKVVKPDDQIIVFEEGNEFATSRMGWNDPQHERTKHPGVVKHVNCGFLPTSEPSWRIAFAAVSGQSPAWLHLHENVAVDDVASRRMAIEALIQSWRLSSKQIVAVEHVELVKTFAPGIWHCVFDVFVGPLAL